MNTFVLDLWHDLREKRLWPVAALLAVGIVAIPLLMLNSGSASGGSSAPNSPAASAAGTDPTVELTDAGRPGSSDLSRSKAKNPFRSTEKLRSAGGLPAGALGAGELSKPALPGGGGSTAPGAPSSASPGASGGGQPSPQTQVPTTLTRYTYVADATFTRNSKSRRVRNMKRLRMLPSSAAPLLLFLGVSSGGNSAAFLVDSSLTAAGEGTCRPSGKDCNVVYIGPGAEHEFTDAEGTSYLLSVNEIRRVKLTPSKRASASKSRAKVSGSGRASPHTPNLIDIETVESGGGSSSSARGR